MEFERIFRDFIGRRRLGKGLDFKLNILGLIFRFVFYSFVILGKTLNFFEF